MVDLIDTNGVKPTLKKGVLGYDDYSVGGDAGRLYVGTGTASIAQAKKSEVDSHTSNVSNPHSVTKTQVGLENVDNTSDANKPVSTATQTALNTKVDKITSTNNALPKFNGTTGALQNSNIINDTAGNVGIGVTPNAITAGYKTLQINGSAGLSLMSSSNDTHLSTNAYYNGGYLYQTTGVQATDYVQTSGAHYWKIAPSGTAGNAITWTNAMTLDSSGNLQLTSGTGRLGYGTGAGGTVTQLTSKSTAVTLNKPCGQIITNNSSLAAGAYVEFFVSNSLVSINDEVLINVTSTGIGWKYDIFANPANSGFYCYLTNTRGSTSSDVIYINFSINKGAIS